MSTFGNFFLHNEYAAIAARGDPLNEIEDLIDRGAVTSPVVYALPERHRSG